MAYVVIFLLGIGATAVAYWLATRGRGGGSAGRAVKAEILVEKEKALRDTESQTPEEAWTEFNDHYPGQ